MDVLSDVMAVLRTGRPFAARFAWRAPWGHDHTARPDALGVYAVVRGSAIVTAESGEKYELREGDALLLPRTGAHTVADAPGSPVTDSCHDSHRPSIDGFVLRSDAAAEAEATHVMMCFSYELAPGRSHPVLGTLPDYALLESDPEARPELANAIAMLDRELRAELSGGEALVQALLDAVLMYTLRACLDERFRHCRAHGWAAALADESVASALEAIHADPARQWTVASLGAAAGLSRSAFSRRFTELVGQPPLAYLTEWRLTLAARLLSETDAPLSAVARKVGYGSEFAFAAAFKRAFGTPPGQFRKGPTCPEQVRAA